MSEEGELFEVEDEFNVFIGGQPRVLVINKILEEGGFSYVYKCNLKEDKSKCEDNNDINNNIVVKVYKGGAAKSNRLFSNEYNIIKHLMKSAAAEFVSELMDITSIFKVVKDGICQYNALIFPFYQLNLHDVLSGQFKFTDGSDKKYGRLPLPIKKIIIKNLLIAISKIHAAGVIHLDLKLENIFLEYEKQPIMYLGVPFPTKIRIIDFNSAVVQIGRNDKEIRRFCGTTSYFSPELILSRPLGRWTDLWAAGVIIYEIITEGYLFESYRGLTSDKAAGTESSFSSTFSFRTSNCSDYPESYCMLRDFYILLGAPPTKIFEDHIGYYYNSRGEPILHPGEMTKNGPNMQSRIEKECSIFYKDEEFFGVAAESATTAITNTADFSTNNFDETKTSFAEINTKKQEFYSAAADLIMSFLVYSPHDRSSLKNVLKNKSLF